MGDADARDQAPYAALCRLACHSQEFREGSPRRAAGSEWTELRKIEDNVIDCTMTIDTYLFLQSQTNTQL